ncbi:16S rRNA (cytidine(1402)-2'-O)-methyltransferase [Lacticaseibacillus sharpeae]|uniref:Ribosomal RNA small subunit methyltransferase I n=1 Tax=Lacticaseibacillus sharpeae JCM 1186 = DSM 20505 TaxID=1291052 RepID=A0A0R1ZRH7_9LACO|nr:16S rRNA (cytidine(1402)-2'-O)-methyltransferase [Lacticaseibacillus sharpeae]KRM54265.1 uroporphyrin-III C tetrapyrrole methyltransferase [Lacticaseibacillus sharpeae JCM 1186 = DSM 20505]
MQLQSSFANHNTGTLYLVPTPIGNLDDMTMRAVKTLQDVDMIAAEDTRNTAKLLNHFEITTKQISFHEHNTQQRIPELLQYLRDGQSIAQVSDAGMPSISDPGKELVAAAIDADIPVVPLPGANAGITALIASGLAPQPFTFYGFVQRKKSVQAEELAGLAHHPATLIFYEAPHRLAKTLTAMAAAFGGDRRAVLARELTKRYEEFARGTLTELIEQAANPRGEYVILVAPGPAAAPAEAAGPELPVVEAVQTLIDAGQKPNAAIKQVAKERGLERQAVYNEFHEID